MKEIHHEFYIQDCKAFNETEHRITVNITNCWDRKFCFGSTIILVERNISMRKKIDMIFFLVSLRVAQINIIYLKPSQGVAHRIICRK